MRIRPALLTALAIVAALTTSPGAAPAQEPVTLTTHAVDALDGNRFFTRVGGTLAVTADYAGLVPGERYTLVTRVVVTDTGEPAGPPDLHPFTPAAAAGTEVVELPIAPNRTQANIELFVGQELHAGETPAGTEPTGAPLAETDEAIDVAGVDQLVEVHAIQSIAVTAVDAADGDRALAGTGGTIRATVEHANLVAGYAYTVAGQLLTTSGQATGVFANVPLYQPADKDGSLVLDFTVPPGFEGQRLVPSIGLFHQNRVTLQPDGSVVWNPGAPQPVMIASDPDLHDPAKTIEIGTPFDAQQDAEAQDVAVADAVAEAVATTTTTPMTPTTAGSTPTTPSTEPAVDGTGPATAPDPVGGGDVAAPAAGGTDDGDDDGAGVPFVIGLGVGAVVAGGGVLLLRRRGGATAGG